MKNRVVTAIIITALTASLSACSMPVTVTRPETKPSSASVEPAETQEPATKEGTRENPYPLGSKVSGEGWDVTINSVNPNAGDLIAAENQFNDAAPEGMVFILINATYTYTGTESATPWLQTDIDYVSADGRVYKHSDLSVVTPGDVSSDELFTGGSTTGNTSIAVPASLDGVLRVSIGLFEKSSTFVAVK